VTGSAGIIGLGLIGGSLAMALKAKCGFTRISAVNRSLPPLEQAKRDGVVDDYAALSDLTYDTLRRLFGGCEVIYLCAPVDQIPGHVELLRGVVSPDCILTDVGSTKMSIYRYMSSAAPLRFIGGHPMAGSEKTGYRNASRYLFENAYYVLTPMPWVSEPAVNRLTQIIGQLGAIPMRMAPDAHDAAVATVSHAPHVIAAALVNLVQSLDAEGDTRALAAGGFKDLTRIASSGPEIWQAISLENRSELLRVLRSFMGVMRSFEERLDNSDGAAIREFFDSAKIYRDSFANNASGAYRRIFEIRVEVEDKPGIIATVAAILSFNGINIKNIGILNSREYENGVLQILFDDGTSAKKSADLLKRMNFIVYDQTETGVQI
jgi:prephenate dehydrogenase